jgi:nucleoside-diphosphate-sugar epimerase
MVALITGASGMVGTGLQRQLLADGHEIICQSRGIRADTPKTRWVRHNLTSDYWEGLKLPDIDVVYHLAGQTSVYQARKDPIADLTANVVGLMRMLEHFRRQSRSPFFVLASTATVAGLTEDLPIDERSPNKPITFYDLSKLSAEMYLEQYVREGWIRGCSLRFANVFGRSLPNQQVDRGIIDKILKRALAGQQLTLYGTGDYLRDYIFVDDIVSALLLAHKHSEQTNGTHFVLGTGNAITVKQAFSKIAAKVRTATGLNADIVHIDPPENLSAIEQRNAAIDSSAFRQATGWRPQFDFDTGLEEACQSLFLPTADNRS